MAQSQERRIWSVAVDEAHQEKLLQISAVLAMQISAVLARAAHAVLLGDRLQEHIPAASVDYGVL